MDTTKLAAIFLGLTAVAIDARAGVFATDWTHNGPVSSLYSVNTSTRTVTKIGSTGVEMLMGLAFDLDNAIYALGERQDSRLYRINPANGAATLVGATGVGLSEGDLAIDPTTGVLYACGNLNDHLYTINKVTGVATLVGSFGPAGRDISAMQFIGGTFYGLAMADTGPDRLVTINPTTGLASIVGLTGTNFGALAAMGVDPLNGNVFIAGPTTLFGNDNQLYTLNLNTGAATFVGALPGFDFSVSGFSAPIPEPAISGLAILAAALMMPQRT